MHASTTTYALISGCGGIGICPPIYAPGAQIDPYMPTYIHAYICPRAYMCILMSGPALLYPSLTCTLYPPLYTPPDLYAGVPEEFPS